MHFSVFKFRNFLNIVRFLQNKSIEVYMYIYILAISYTEFTVLEATRQLYLLSFPLLLVHTLGIVHSVLNSFVLLAMTILPINFLV